MKLTWNDLMTYAAAVLQDPRDPAEIDAAAVQFVTDNPERTFDDLMKNLFPNGGLTHAAMHSEK